MAHLRLTLLQPRPGSEAEARRLMEELDSELADASGLILSLIMARESHIGRVSLWRSKEDANREAINERTLSLCSRLRYIATEAEESMLEVESGHLPEGFSALFGAQKRSITFPPPAHQAPLPAM
jgi:hypothetical protein